MGTVLTAHGKYVNNQRHDGENTQIQLQKNVRVCVCVRRLEQISRIRVIQLEIIVTIHRRNCFFFS